MLMVMLITATIKALTKGIVITKQLKMQDMQNIYDFYL
jgi:hypothetical protein